MKIYLFDEDTKEYLEQAEAQPSPLEPGKYLYPVYSTTVAPPEEVEGYVYCWNGKEWVKTEDHRQKYDDGGVVIEGVGTPYWLDGDTYTTRARYMDMPGPLPEGALLKQPDMPFELAQKQMIEKLNQTYSETYDASSVVSSMGFTINANAAADRNIANLILTMDDTETVLFRDYDNQFKEVNKEQLVVMQKEVIARSQDLLKTKWQYRSLIDAATTNAELNAITITF